MSSSRPLDDAQKQGGFLQAVQSQVKIESNNFGFSKVMTEKLSLSHQTVGKITMVTTESRQKIQTTFCLIACLRFLSYSFRLPLMEISVKLLNLSSSHVRWVSDLVYC